MHDAERPAISTSASGQGTLVVDEQVDEEHAEQRDHRADRSSMPPVMMTKPWPIAKRPNRPIRLAVLARLIGDRKRGLMMRDDRADHQDQDEKPEVLLQHRAPPLS